LKLKSISIITLLIASIIGCRNNDTETTRPNILFAISDDQSFVHTGFHGSKFVKTPAFDKIAREGVYFSNCYSASPGCAPSRSSIVTGRYHWQNEQSGQHASSWMKKHIPFVDLLDQNGYITGRTGKGVSPFKYARDETDSLWRVINAAGIAHNEISYKIDSVNDDRFADGISRVNYFESFKFFIEHIKNDKPFFFWYGAYEPHRKYEKDSYERMGKKLEDAEVPGFLPDNDLVRGDLLDYAIEIEWFDLHLERILEYLEEIGELENTIVIVTSDNGKPFPRAKANSYEYGIHVPLAIRFPEEFPGNRVVDDPVSFVDLAPTILELTRTKSIGMLPISGRSILNILKSKKQGIVDDTKQYVFAGRERHSSSRYLNWGFPQRIIRGDDYLYIWNIRPKRWPAGAPQKFDPKDTTSLLPLYGLDTDGTYIPGAAFMDVDDCPTKTYLIENYNDEEISPFFDLAYGKRPEVELYNVKNDPFCLNNLSLKLEFMDIEKKLKKELKKELEKSGDPRLVGPDTEVFDSYQRYSPMRKFMKPEVSI